MPYARGGLPRAPHCCSTYVNFLLQSLWPSNGHSSGRPAGMPAGAGTGMCCTLCWTRFEAVRGRRADGGWVRANILCLLFL